MRPGEGMIKIVPPSWDFGEPLTTHIGSVRRGLDTSWLEKRASAFSREDLDFERQPGHSYLHIIAVGDYEFTGPNINADAFTEKGGTFNAFLTGKPIEIKVGNVQTHDTFVKLGRVYRDHKHQDVSLSYGPVIKSAHNDRMKRVELIVGVPTHLFEPELQKLAKNEQVGWSMACRVPGDICSACGHHAKTRKQYCDHAKYQLGAVVKEGHRVCVFNDHMQYFDISQVFKPAEQIALTIRKVAGDARAVCGGAELAERLGLTMPRWLPAAATEKQSAAAQWATKMAAMEIELDQAASPVELAGLRRGHLLPRTRTKLAQYAKSDVLAAMNEAKVCPSLADFLAIFGDKPASDVPAYKEAAAALPRMYRQLATDMELASVADLAVKTACTRNLIPVGLMSTLNAETDSISLADESVRKRLVTACLTESAATIKAGTDNTATPLSPQARLIHQAYASYQLGLLSRHSEDPELPRRLVIGNRESA